MADQRHVIEIVVDDHGALTTLRKLDAEHGKGASAAEKQAKSLSGLERAMTKATAAGQIAADIISGLARAAVGGFISTMQEAVKRSAAFEKAMTGLGTVANNFGISTAKATEAAQALSADGLIPLGDSSEALKNLLSTGFGLEDSVKLLQTFKDSAAFGAQGMLSMGDAVVRATQGIKFGNSALTDSTGLGKNLSVIMREAGLAESMMGMAAQNAAVRQAILNGFLKEGAMFAGDAAKRAQTYQGQMDRLKTSYDILLVELGNFVTRNATIAEALKIVGDAVQGLTVGLAANGKGYSLVSEIVIALVKTLALLVRAVDFVQKGFYSLRYVFDGIIWALAEAGKAVSGFILGVLKTAAAVPGASKVIVGLTEALADAQVKYDESSALAYNFGQAMDETAATMNGNSAALEGFAGKLDAAVVRLEATKGKTVELAESQERQKRTTQAAATETAKHAEELKKFVKSMGELSGSLAAAEARGLSQTEILASMGDEIRKAGEQARFFRLEADKVPDVLERWIETARKADFAKIVADANKSLAAQMREVADAAAAADRARVQQYLTATGEQMAALNELYWEDREAKATSEEAKLQLTLDRLEFQEQAEIESLDKTTAVYQELVTAIGAKYARLRNDAKRAFHDQAADAKAAAGSIGQSFAEVFNGIPKLLTQAFTGGGGMKGFASALKTQFTDVLGNVFDTKVIGPLFAKASGAISKVFGQGVTKVLGSMLPGIGDLLATGLGKIVGKLFGPSKGKLLGMEADKEIKALQDELLETYGSLEGIKKAGGAAGEALVAAWGDKNVQGLAHFKGLLDQFNVSLAETARLEKEREETLKQIQATEDELAKLSKDRAADGQASWAAMKEAAERYGISLDSLGARANQLRLDEAASAIINDFDLLTQGGTDVGTVLHGMANEISGLVQDAKQFGTVIPGNMEPWIRNLMETGQLLDASGEKITDISDLQFGAAMESEWAAVTGAIKELQSTLELLRQTLERTLPQAAQMAASGVQEAFADPIEIRYRYTTEGERPDGGEVFHQGGVVNKWRAVPRYHDGLAPDERPAVLQVGEGVVSRKGMKRLGSRTLEALNQGAPLPAAGGAVATSPDAAPSDVTINITVAPQLFDPSGLDRIIEDRVLPTIIEHVQDNRRGVRTNLRIAQGLGS
jgi:hypothetical protein